MVEHTPCALFFHSSKLILACARECWDLKKTSFILTINEVDIKMGGIFIFH